jgi:hypothetical protein
MTAIGMLRALVIPAVVAATATAVPLSAQLVILAEDRAYGEPADSDDFKLWDTGLAGLIIQRAYDRQVTEVATNLHTAIALDVLDLGSRELHVPESVAATPVVTALTDISDERVLAAMDTNGAKEALLVRYYFVADRLFWARLIVQRVTLTESEPAATHVATLYYLAALPVEHHRTKEGWSPAALANIAATVGPSFVELGNLWAQISADTRDGAVAQETWKPLPDLVQPQDGWVFGCRGLKPGCRRQRLVRLTDTRVWISSYEGPVLASLDHDTAESAVAFVVVQMPVR